MLGGPPARVHPLEDDPVQLSAPLPPWFQRLRARPQQLLQALLLAILVIQGVRLTWMVVPPAPVGSPAAVSAGKIAAALVTTGFDPFFPSTASAQAADVSGITLHGISSGPAGASAILGRAEGGQSSFRPGESVQPGVHLVSIGTDHVVLGNAQGVRRLDFGQGTASAAAPTSLPGAAPVSAAAPQALDPARLLEQAGLAPREVGGQVSGYTLIPRGDGAVLRQAGLQAGDVVLSINGQALTPESYQDLAELMAGQPNLEITVQRNGATRALTVPLQ